MCGVTDCLAENRYFSPPLRCSDQEMVNIVLMEGQLDLSKMHQTPQIEETVVHGSYDICVSLCSFWRGTLPPIFLWGWSISVFHTKSENSPDIDLSPQSSRLAMILRTRREASLLLNISYKRSWLDRTINHLGGYFWFAPPSLFSNDLQFSDR